MIELDPTRFKQIPFPPMRHQIVGVKALVKHPAFYLGDKPRTCKSRQVVDAACVLHETEPVDLILVISPVAGRAVWGDKDMGQIKTWSWRRARVCQFHAKITDLWSDDDPEMLWVVTNYDFVRSKNRLAELTNKLRECDKFMLVLDESAALGNEKSDQSKAIDKIRWLKKCPNCKSFNSKTKRTGKTRSHECLDCGRSFTDKTAVFICSRCVMLNGSDELPPNIWSQFNILDDVLNRRYSTFTHFKWQYMKYGPPHVERKEYPRKSGGTYVWEKRVCDELGWKNLDNLSRITAPYVLRRTRKDCPELRDIPVLYDVKEVSLKESTWKMYKQLKKEAVIELEKEVYVSPNAGVRLMRLAQITSGHLGGFEEGEKTRDLSSEKLDWLTRWLVERCTAHNFIVWCRWVRERERLVEMLTQKQFKVYELYGGQPRAERRASELVFTAGANRLPGRHAMVAQPQAGGICLDLSAASEVFRMSSDYSTKTREQSDDRPLGPAQQAEAVTYTDVLATGPNGQRTMDHIIIAALRAKKNLALLTSSEWRKKLEEE